MSAVAGTLVKSRTHFCQQDRKTITVTQSSPVEGFVTIAFTDADDTQSAMLVPEAMFLHVIGAYLNAP